MNELQEAAQLLDSPLIWSADLDQIRYHLAGMLRAIDECRDPSKYAQDVSETLLNEFHNEIALG